MTRHGRPPDHRRGRRGDGAPAADRLASRECEFLGQMGCGGRGACWASCAAIESNEGRGGGGRRPCNRYGYRTCGRYVSVQRTEPEFARSGGRGDVVGRDGIGRAQG